MDPFDATLIVGAGLIAGAMNAIVGSGSLITFPTLLFLGYSPLVANVSNTAGLVPGSISAVVGYRRELVGQRSRAIPVVVAGGLGGLTGGVLLLVLPEVLFERIVPLLILFATFLVAVQPRLSAWLDRRRARHPVAQAGPRGVGSLLLATVYLTGIYGGYFGAGQGVILIALLAILVDDDLQRLNGLKNLVAMVINAVAAVLFLLVAPVDLAIVALIAIGSVAGGQLGAAVGRRLSPFALRGVIVIVGTIVGLRLLVA